MIGDLFTIIRKEWKEVFLMRGSVRSGLLNLVIILGLIGVFMPLQTGEAWLKSPVPVIVWSWMPIFMALSVVTDAIAGERERHTLETLLASRLSDQAILFGKILAAVLYAWSIAITGLLLAALTINLAVPGEGIRFYEPAFFLAALAVSLLAALFFSSLGVLVSLRAQTARQAYQRLSVVMVILWLLPTIGVQVLPESALYSLRAVLDQVNLQAVILGIIGVLLAADMLLLILARARFQRARLILD